jgi:hypothetical protein
LYFYTDCSVFPVGEREVTKIDDFMGKISVERHYSASILKQSRTGINDDN